MSLSKQLNLYRTNPICVCATGKDMVLDLISLYGSGVIEKSNLSIISFKILLEYDATNNCTNPIHICLYQLVLVEKKNKNKSKNKKYSPGNKNEIVLFYLSPFRGKRR